MARSAKVIFSITVALSLSTAVNAYWLMGVKNFITTERIDPIVNPGVVSGHVHSVLGGSNFGFTSSTAKLLQSECTSIPIIEDKSNYWFPHLYFQWANGSFSSLTGGAVIYYLFPDAPGKTKAFPRDFRMLSGNPTKRTYDPASYESRAIDFLCLDFNGQTTKHVGLPNKACPSGIRSQVNFPSCWDGKNLDSPDHKSHVAYRSGGPDSGECTDPNYPISIPRIFIEVYWGSADWDKLRPQAMNVTQPFVFAYGDRTGYGNHADFFNGWEDGVLQKAVDGCTCNIYGDPTCCVEKGLFSMDKDNKCFITKSVNEETTGMLPKLPGNNPVQEEGKTASMLQDPVIPGIISPVYVYRTEGKPTATGKVTTPASTPPATGSPNPPVAAPSSSSLTPVVKPISPTLAPSSSSLTPVVVKPTLPSLIPIVVPPSSSPSITPVVVKPTPSLTPIVVPPSPSLSLSTPTVQNPVVTQSSTTIASAVNLPAVGSSVSPVKPSTTQKAISTPVNQAPSKDCKSKGKGWHHRIKNHKHKQNPRSSHEVVDNQLF